MNFKTLILSSTLVATAFAANVPPVVPPARRSASLETAKNLLEDRDAALPANSTSPFNSEAFAAATGASRPTTPTDTTTPEVRTGPRTERQLLESIAGELRPNYLVFGGVPYLVFGQKRVKAGDPLTITFEGTEHTLEIVSINPKHFTLRLNREEFTRPIK